MQKNIFLKLGLITTITICVLCILIKSFLAVHYKSELDGGEMSLVFKINPLGNNLIFEDKNEANFFLRTNPESYSGTIFNPIFDIPLPILIFFLLLLISICVKKKNPKLKKRWLIIPTIVTPILIWIIWLFQTYEYDPSEKIYSTDKQYSYYLEEYNYNLITKRIFGMFHETEYKVFVYDEITGKMLYSGYAGGKTLLRDYFGFDEECDQFHLTKPDYIKLPRPIDKKAIKQQQRREKAVSDSICWVHEEKQAKTEFYRLAPINHDEFAYIQPVIKKWADYYKIDLSQARFIRMDSTCFNCPPDLDKIGIYRREFKPEDDSPQRIEVSYSPNKQRYVDIGVICEIVDGKHYDTGLYDDSQEVYLIDRKLKHQNILFYNGVSNRIHDIFWKTNDVFITVGIDMLYNTLNKYVISVFDLRKQTKKQYELLTDKNPYIEFGSYHEEYLKNRGIIKGY
jgi:hypothetical protein